MEIVYVLTSARFFLYVPIFTLSIYVLAYSLSFRLCFSLPLYLGYLWNFHP